MDFISKIFLFQRNQIESYWSIMKSIRSVLWMALRINILTRPNHIHRVFNHNWMNLKKKHLLECIATLYKNPPKQKWNVNSHSMLTQCSPSTHLIRCALQVGTKWALQKGNGEQNISWVSDVYWVSTRWALGEYWQRCLRRCALGEYCTCLEVCTRWALDLDNLCRWILGEYWTLNFFMKVCTRWALDLNILCRWILDEYWT